jgi:hypothetical protein
MRFLGTTCRLSPTPSILSNYHSPQRSSFRAMSAVVNQHASPHQIFADVSALNHYNDFLHPSKNVVNEPPYLIQNRSLVMINSATMDIDLVKILWDHCDHKICADGGANRLFDGLSSTEVAQYIPGIIKYSGNRSGCGDK